MELVGIFGCLRCRLKKVLNSILVDKQPGLVNSCVYGGVYFWCEYKQYAAVNCSINNVVGVFVTYMPTRRGAF